MNESKELVSFLELSEEMALHIFKYCTLQTKYFLTSTSKFCRRVVCDDELKLKDGLLDLAIIVTERQDYKSGLFILRKIIHIFPTCPDVWKEVGLCYKQMDDFENAIEALFIALDNCEGTFRLYIESQIYLYAKADGTQLAYEKICHAIQQDPNELKYYHFRAFIEAAIQNTFEIDAEDTIEKHHESLLREFKDYDFISGKPYKRMASIYNNIGAVYFEQGNVEKALEYFGKSISQCPYYVQAFYNKAIVYRSIGNAKCALLEYESILHKNAYIKRIHTLSDLTLHRGQCYYAMRSYHMAEKEFYLDFHQLSCDYDSINGFFKSTIRTHNLKKILRLFPNAIDKLVAKLDDALEQLNEMLPLMKKTMSEGDEFRNTLRIEAKEKQYKKQYNESFNALKLATRLCTEVLIVRGKFQQAKKYLKLGTDYKFELGAFCPFVFTAIPEAPLGTNMMFIWNFLNALGDCSDLDEKLNSSKKDLSGTKYLGLSSSNCQVFFISCFAYFYLNLHSSLLETNFKLLDTFCGWLVEQEKNKSILFSICASPYIVIYMFEIFKLIPEIEKRDRILAKFEERIQKLVLLKRNIHILNRSNLVIERARATLSKINAFYESQDNNNSEIGDELNNRNKNNDNNTNNNNNNEEEEGEEHQEIEKELINLHEETQENLDPSIEPDCNYDFDSQDSFAFVNNNYKDVFDVARYTVIALGFPYFVVNYF